MIEVQETVAAGVVRQGGQMEERTVNQVFFSAVPANVPKYLHIKGEIIYNIRVGNLKQGEAIPPESWYKKTYGVSSITVRKAFQELIKEEALFAKQGKGTFVKREYLLWKTSAGSFADNIRQQNTTPTTSLLDVTAVVVPEIARMFQLPPSSPLTLVKRLRLSNGQPAAVSLSYLPETVLRPSDRIFLERHLSLYKVLGDKHIVPYSTVETFSVEVVSDKSIYTYLNCGYNDPLIYGQRNNYSEDNKLFEYTRNYLRSDMYKIVSSYHPHANTRE